VKDILTILVLLMGSPNAVPIRRNLRLEECGDDQCQKCTVLQEKKVEKVQ
jgi:hypothetical protein